MDIPASIAAESAILKQSVTLSLIKKSAEADRQIANILETAIQNVPASSRGSSLNIKA